MYSHIDGGRAEGLACADPGARTPIGASGNYKSILLGDLDPSPFCAYVILENFNFNVLYVDISVTSHPIFLLNHHFELIITYSNTFAYARKLSKYILSSILSNKKQLLIAKS